MLTTKQHKLLLGYYEKEFIGILFDKESDRELIEIKDDDNETTRKILEKVPTKFQNIITCAICNDSVDITEQCVINNKCISNGEIFPHPLHLACYDSMVTGKPIFILNIANNKVSELTLLSCKRWME
jgi:hypothetical protein